MAQTITVKAKGIIRTQNPFGDAPEGALKDASNIVVSRDGIFEQRRGMAVWSSPSGAVMVKKLFAFADRLLAFYEASGPTHKLAFSSADFLTWTDYSGTYEQPAGGTTMRGTSARNNFYLTHLDGVKRLDAVTGTPQPAGSPQGLDIEATLVSGVVGTALKGDARFAYRVVWGLRDANSNLILGAPSGRFVVTSPAVDVSAASLSRTGTTVTAQVASHGFANGDKVIITPGETNFPAGQKTITGVTSTTFTYTEAGSATTSTQNHRFALDTSDATLQISIPPNITSSHFAQIYRSPGSENAEVEPTDNLGLVFEKNAPGQSTVSGFSRTGSTVTVTTVAAHNLDTGAFVDITGFTQDFPRGVKQIIVTSSTTFTYTEAGAATSEGNTGRAVVPLTMVVTDSLPDSLLGAGLYTNPQEEGILNANTSPPSARELAFFKGSLIFANCDVLARLFVTLLSTGAPSGVQVGDSFLLDGLAYTAGSSESYNTRTFKVFTDSTPSLNVARTAASICRVINRTPVNTTTLAYVVAGPDDEPGRMVFERRTFGQSIVYNPVDTKNYLTRTQEFDHADWTKNNSSASANSTTGPDGTSTADTLTDSGSNTTHSVLQTENNVAVGNWVFSVSLKANTLTTAAINIWDGTTDKNVTVNLSTGAITAISGTGITQVSVESQGSSWYRISIGLNVQSSVNLQCGIFLKQITAYVGTSQSLYAWGAQLERGIYPSAYQSVSASFSSAHPNAWNPPKAQTEASQVQKDSIYWSKFNQPDAVPLLQFQRLGAADKAILRCVPTRDSNFIFKEDGIWKMSGEGANSFRFDQVDTTLQLVAPETAVSQDGTAFGLTEQGVVRVTENGILVISRGIEVDLYKLIAGPLHNIASSLAFAVAYESDRKYMMWVPTGPSDVQCQEAFVYDLFTESWSKRSDAHRCGIVNPTDEKLYLAESNLVWQERKNFDDTDLVDRAFSHTINAVSSDGKTLTLDSVSGIMEGDGILQGNNFAVITAIAGSTVVVDRAAGFSNGGCTRLTGINSVTEWTPKFGDNPSVLHHFQEVTLFFDKIYFAEATLEFSTNISPTYEAVALSGASLGFTPGSNSEPFQLRALVPRSKRRASQLNIRFTHRQARSKVSIQGLSVTYASGTSSRVGK